MQAKGAGIVRPGARSVVRALLLGMMAAAVVPTSLLAQAQPGKSDVDACQSKDVLGVERVVEVDTAEGPRLGNLQYQDFDFLEPGEVVLTFDDGPSRQTTETVLAALAAHCTKATFFMVGRMALAEPDLAKRVAALGHTVGTHTWSHANLGSSSKEKMVREIEMGVSAVSAALGQPVAPFFRFPYLSAPKRGVKYLEERNLGIFSIDVDSFDYRTRSAAKMQQTVLAGLKARGKGIILFHDIQHSTARGVMSLLDELKRRGYKVVHLKPKQAVTTVAKYDAIAGNELARRVVKTSGQPLASRSMVWPVAGAKPGTDGVGVPGSEVLPSVAADPAEAERSRKRSHQLRAAEQKPRPSWKQEEIPWQEKMLRHLN